MKPTTVSAITLGLVALVVATASVHGSVPVSPVEMTFDEIQEYSILKPAMAELSKKLGRSVWTAQRLDNIRSVRASLETEFGPKVRGSKALMRRSMLLLESLEYVSLSCGLDGYEALSRFYLALPDKHDCDGSTRIYEIFNELRRDHAKLCLPRYKSEFAKLQQKVPKHFLEKLEMAFSDLEGDDFYCIKKGDTRALPDAFAMLTPVFKRDCSESALNKIASNVARQIKGTPQWESLTPIESSHFGISHKKQPKIPQTLFDEYLFNPCKIYLGYMTDKLTSARFDVYFSNNFESSSAQEEYISGDGAFYQALIYNRFCRSLLRDQEKLYKPLRKAWKRSSGSF